MAKPSLNDNALYAYRYYQDKWKLKPYQAAGIVGNLMQESTMNPGARNAGDGRDGSDSIGQGQWNGDRARALKAFAADRGTDFTDRDTQLDFVMHEMQNGGEKNAYNRLMNAENLHDATAAMISYERPQGWKADNPTAGHGWDNRLAWAGEVMGMTPEQIAAAQPTAPVDASQLQARASAQAQQPPAQTAAVEPPKDKDKPLFELPKLFPDKILGVDTKKGLNVFGGFGDMMAKQDQANNQQIAQAGQAGAARRQNAQPVQIVANPVPLFGGAGGQMDPAQMEELKKKLLMQRLGGLGGLGGFGRV